MKISIIVPVYHEEKNILNVFKQIKKLVKTEHELLVVYDSKEDPTYPVMNMYLSKKRLNNIKLVENCSGNKKGVMNAIKTGFRKAKGDAVVVLMADLSDDITQIDEMKKLIDTGYDIVCASRYMKGGKKIGGPFIKSLLSKTAGLTLHWFFGVPTHDSTNAFKMYKKKVLNSIKVESTGGFEYSLEIVLKAFKKGYRITEIPTVWTDRVNGKSNFKLMKWLPNYISWYTSIFK
jgi:dolichol-phosphate mannosyltransferase